jgi:rare lipoprotein A (peptidoglycan hydrolase)
VQVIDRGPYVEGREYDLTEATARRIGFDINAGVAEIRVSP